MIRGAEKRVNDSGLFLAIVLGDISPKVRITTVSIAVDIAELHSSSEPSYRMSMKSIVSREEASILTMLFPIRIVERSVS